MINFDDFTKGNIKEHNPNWLQLSDHQPDIDKIYFYAKDLYEAKSQLLIK